MTPDDAFRAYLATKEAAIGCAATIRRADDAREVRSAAKRLALLNERIAKLAPELGDHRGTALAVHADGLRVLERAEARAKQLEREAADG